MANVLKAAHGSRKSSVANAHISAGSGSIIVRKSYSKRDILNMKRRGKDLTAIKKSFELEEYFSSLHAYDVRDYILTPLTRIDKAQNFNVVLTMHGGGIKCQLQAARLAIAKALVGVDESFKPALSGLLCTDARRKERRKIGCRGKARRKVQFSKR